MGRTRAPARDTSNVATKVVHIAVRMRTQPVSLTEQRALAAWIGWVTRERIRVRERCCLLVHGRRSEPSLQTLPHHQHLSPRLINRRTENWTRLIQWIFERIKDSLADAMETLLPERFSAASACKCNAIHPNG